MSRARLSSSAGYSLLEVLIAVAVTAIGLLGGGLMLTVSVKQNHLAAQNADVVQLGEGMIDRMHTNGIGVWLGAYDGSYTAASAAASFCTFDDRCSAVELAQTHVSEWMQELSLALVEPEATIECTRHGPVPPADELAHAPPYDGFCTLSLSWQAAGERADSLDRQIAWQFQP